MNFGESFSKEGNYKMMHRDELLKQVVKKTESRATELVTTYVSNTKNRIEESMDTYWELVNSSIDNGVMEKELVNAAYRGLRKVDINNIVSFEFDKFDIKYDGRYIDVFSVEDKLKLSSSAQEKIIRDVQEKLVNLSWSLSGTWRKHFVEFRKRLKEYGYVLRPDFNRPHSNVFVTNDNKTIKYIRDNLQIEF